MAKSISFTSGQWTAQKHDIRPPVNSVAHKLANPVSDPRSLNLHAADEIILTVSRDTFFAVVVLSEDLECGSSAEI